MKKMKFLNGIGAMFALAVVALATTFTSCQKEEFNVDIKPADAQATVSPIVLFVNVDGVTTDVTSTATFNPELPKMVYTGNPDLAAKTEALTVSYEYTDALTGKQVTVSSTVNVLIPALKAGQFATITPTIILQAKGSEISYEDSPQASTIEEETIGYVENATDFYWTTSRTYLAKKGRLIGEDAVSFTADATDMDKIYINNFASALKYTYEEYEATLDGIYVGAHSRTYIKVSYEVVESVVTFYKNITLTKADADAKIKIGTIVYKDYATKTADITECDQPIPGHSHAPSHYGHGHGDDSNAGGGIIVAD